MKVVDIHAITSLGKTHDLLVAVDNTFITLFTNNP